MVQVCLAPGRDVFAPCCNDTQSLRIPRLLLSFNGIKKSKHSRRMLPINRSQNAFAWGARNGVLGMLKPIESMDASNAEE